MLNEIESSNFTYELYKPELLGSLPKQHTIGIVDYLMKIEKYGLGTCDGTLLEFRPRSDADAVMFEYKGEKFWLHVEHRWLEATDELIWLLDEDV